MKKPVSKSKDVNEFEEVDKEFDKLFEGQPIGCYRCEDYDIVDKKIKKFKSFLHSHLSKSEKRGEERERKRADNAEKLLDDVIMLFDLENSGTNLILEAKEIMKRRVNEGKSCTAYWYDLFDSLTHQKG